jgi:alkylation response protein AidB-like acyl-CoA dehydrogenase
VSALRAEETEADEVEDVESFRRRARAFITANLEPKSVEDMRHDYSVADEETELASIAHERALQRMLYDAGFAGLCFPRAYGGQGLTPEHQRVFNEEIVGRDFPWRIQVPTFVPCAAVILEFGTEEQKQRYLPPILRGEELWMQFLSEPSGGSDVAGALTTAVRDGDQWVLNGSKIWTTGAWWSDWGLCLARTNWDVPKHRGLTVFMLPIHQPNVEVHRIEMLNGSREFCQEFLTDVVVPDSDRIGDVDDGWTVGTRWMFHERMLFNSPYVSHPAGVTHGSMDALSVFSVAQEAGLLDDTATQEMIGEARMLELVGETVGQRINESIAAGTLSDQAAAIVRLFKGSAQERVRTLGFEAAGSSGAAWSGDGPMARAAIGYLIRQGGSIGGGTLEMARNVVAERVLGMPRERRLDKDVPFRDVPRSRPSTG